tara:strand:+ start:569 stop:1861 length:1293 start_codon:yes stop_codon:yes gene_type:complete
VNKLSLLIILLLFINNCSIKKSKDLFSKKTINTKKIENVKTILTKQARKELEFNPNLKIKFSDINFNKSTENNQNDLGNIFYEGALKKIGKYKFSKFNDFKYINVKPLFYNKNVIFFDNKGAIIFYDQNEKKIWKKNYYNKYEKKLKPRLNFAQKDKILIVADDIAKYYAIDIETGNLLWTKTNIVPFNSEIKVKDNIFYVVDYKNILRAISIIDGSEVWSIKTEESLTKSGTKTSVIIKENTIYFNNSIGDVTAVNLKTGQLIWQLPTQNNNISKNAFQLSNSEMIINENSIFFSNNKNEFYSIDTSTGLINWKNEINSENRPIIIGKFIITISKKGYLYLVDKKSGNIIRVNNLYKNYKNKNNIYPTGFLVAKNKIYLSNNDGKLIIVDLDNVNTINTAKIARTKILQPLVHNNNLFLISNGSIIKFN